MKFKNTDETPAGYVRVTFRGMRKREEARRKEWDRIKTRHTEKEGEGEREVGTGRRTRKEAKKRQTYDEER